jgi:NADH-quinone oxidoreductase subunit F
MGSHKSKPLGIANEDTAGVHPGLEFLKAFNLEGEQLATGHVGVIGGGDSAIDAAGVAIRQPGVEKVTIYYRRSRTEMPAHPDSLRIALEEGVELETLVTPVRAIRRNGRVAAVEFQRNRLGDFDSSGRRRPETIPDSEHVIELDTLIAAIGEEPNVPFLEAMGIELTSWHTVKSAQRTLETNRPGVFAGGDVVTGPNTVVDAIASGKRAAYVIDRWLRGESPQRPMAPQLPKTYVAPVAVEQAELDSAKRAEPPRARPETRVGNLREVEHSLSIDDARREARRCLRCDLDFTRPARHDTRAQPGEAETAVRLTVGATP